MRAVRSWLCDRAPGSPIAWLIVACAVAIAGAAALPSHASAQDASLFTTIGITQPDTRAKSQINGSYSFRAQEMPVSDAIVTPPNDATDDVPLRMPDTSGNVANLAAFRGQELELREAERQAYTRIHFFGTTTDGGPAGGAFTLVYTDGTRTPVTVQFRDWCAPQDTAAHHSAIGPLGGRHTSSGQDSARCAIFHVPAGVAADKTLAAVVFPPSTTPGGGAIQSYLMAITLERADGTFVLPNLAVAPLVDRTAPRTTVRVSPAEPLGTQGWYDGTVTVTVTMDDGPGAGVAATSFRIDGGPWTTIPISSPLPGPVAFTVDAAGAHVVEYRSEDREGNVEVIRSLSLKIDRTPPVTAALINGAAPVARYAGGARVAFARADGAGSGAVSTEYRVGGGAWTPYAGAFDLTALGAYRVDFRSRDLVGNVELYRSIAFEVVAAPLATGTPAVPRPFASLEPVARRRSTVAALRRGRFAIRVTCQAVQRGSVRLAVARETARRLGLGSRVLAARALGCDEGRAMVSLRPGSAVRRALARSRGRITATLTLRMSGAAGTVTDRAEVVLRGAR